ncbi:MAG: Alpha-glucan family phosphorylase [Euryarchaeota archaeon]|nr:Alpha-glucan family phosphorylase [Euryarchaeota archaeon]
MDNYSGKFPYLPERISRLGELACNLWWSWHPEARALFYQLAGNGSQYKAQNPVKLLFEIDCQILDDATRNPRFLRRYDAVMTRFDSEMNAYQSWFNSKIENRGRLHVAYFSAEFGLHQSLPFYAGGLGFLAGDYLKECSDLGVPVVGVGFMYPEGYLHQRLSADGWQMSESESLDRVRAPICRVLDAEGRPLTLKVTIMQLPVYFEVWKAQIGRVPLYLIDTDLEANDPRSRSISSRLYIGDHEHRLVQEIILGIGGTQILRALGIKHFILHLNEGHSSFAILERIREMVENGKSFAEAVGFVRKTTIFTTHTPVPAGHDIFSIPMMDKYFASYIPMLGISREEFYRLGEDPSASSASFNMTVFALRLSAHCNAVSKRHGEVARQMWQHLWQPLAEHEVPIDYITNGVHVPTWIDSRMALLFNRYLGPNWIADHDDPSIWELVDDIPDEKLWMVHRHQKMNLIAVLQERARQRWLEHADPNIILASGTMLDPNALTLGFARRFASYKRANLILEDLTRLKAILGCTNMPVQIIFAGKAHPSDDAGIRLIQQVYNVAHDPDFGGRVAFIEDYNEGLAQYLIHGVDVWLNNPQPPFEASGTSGMKAGINGVPHLSVLDGWWIEGYNRANGWAFDGNDGESCERDAKELYSIIERQIVPLYYDQNESGISPGWINIMKASIKSTAARFSSRRMVKEYANKFYQDALIQASET